MSGILFGTQYITDCVVDKTSRLILKLQMYKKNNFFWVEPRNLLGSLLPLTHSLVGRRLEFVHHI